MKELLASDSRPLSDDEVGKLYGFCLSDTKFYNLLRRLVLYGQIPDPETVATPGATVTGEDSSSVTMESSRPRELLASKEQFEQWWAANPEPWGDARSLAELAWDASRRLAPETCEQRSQAATDVLAERLRQVTAEGWAPEHDDLYMFGELAEAAAAYLRHVSLHWPNGWDKAWYKPTTRRRDLVKSAALIVAEIERLDRASMKASEAPAHCWRMPETCIYVECKTSGKCLRPSVSEPDAHS